MINIQLGMKWICVWTKCAAADLFSNVQENFDPHTFLFKSGLMS